MEKIGIFYGSTTGNTEAVANKLQEVFGSENADVYDVASASKSDIEKYSNIILGCSTWGIGELQDDFDTFLSNIENAKLDGKKIAIFGTGDQSSFADSFVDSIGIIYETIQDKPCTIIGEVSTNDYNYSESKADINSVFVGLPIDEDNESDKTEQRILNWTKILRKDFI